MQFLVNFSVVHVCGTRSFTAEENNEKLVEAPPYPGSYGSCLYCWHTITAPDHNVIRFWVEDFGTGRFDGYYYYIRVSFA